MHGSHARENGWKWTFSISELISRTHFRLRHHSTKQRNCIWKEVLESGTPKGDHKSHAEVDNRGIDCLRLCIKGGLSLLVANVHKLVRNSSMENPFSELNKKKLPTGESLSCIILLPNYWCDHLVFMMISANLCNMYSFRVSSYNLLISHYGFNHLEFDWVNHVQQTDLIASWP